MNNLSFLLTLSHNVRLAFSLFLIFPQQHRILLLGHCCMYFILFYVFVYLICYRKKKNLYCEFSVMPNSLLCFYIHNMGLKLLWNWTKEINHFLLDIYTVKLLKSVYYLWNLKLINIFNTILKFTSLKVHKLAIYFQ